MAQYIREINITIQNKQINYEQGKTRRAFGVKKPEHPNLNLKHSCKDALVVWELSITYGISLTLFPIKTLIKCPLNSPGAWLRKVL